MNASISFRKGLSLAALMLGVLCLIGCASPSGKETEPKVADVIVGYTKYNKMTHHPVSVDPFIMSRCMPTFKEELDVARVKHGPHANAMIFIYMNDLAAGSFTNRTNVYPVGSVIAKQKMIQDYYDEKLKKSVTGNNGLGGMVKRAPGYDPANGDWEYFYWEEPVVRLSPEKPPELVSGRIASCVQCHAYAEETDRVFGTWRGRYKL
jgi:hypothetical protein